MGGGGGGGDCTLAHCELFKQAKNHSFGVVAHPAIGIL